MNRYEVSFSVKISPKGNSWSSIVDCSQSETVPEGEDPVTYLRARLASEIKRITKGIEFDDGLEG